MRLGVRELSSRFFFCGVFLVIGNQHLMEKQGDGGGHD
jgi:hypothetical protein